MSAIQKIEPQSGAMVVTDESTLLAVIGRLASDPNADIDKMERLMQMYDRISDKKAEQQFNEALTRAQSIMRPISADATNPQTRSRYATYAKLDNALRPIYTQEGFSLSFNTAKAEREDCLGVICYVAHSSGHKRTYQADMPNDGKGAKGGDVMTKTHAQGSAASYGMRYLLKMIFNVAIGEDDNDGNDRSKNDEKAKVRADEWAEKIKDAADIPTLDKTKQDCCKAYGFPDKVPANLQQLFRARRKELS